MKQWTRENMRLLSKWRASKRAMADAAAGAGGERSHAERDGGTPRVFAAMEESGADAPGSPTSVADQAGDYYKHDDGDDRSGPSKYSMYEPHHPQMPLWRELFYFFLKRSWKKKLFTVIVVLTIVPVLLDMFIFRSGHVTQFLDDFLHWMAENPMLGVWAYIFMMVLTSLVFIPPSLLVFAAGFTFQSLFGLSGLLIALVASFLGSTMGGLVGFWRARYMTRDLIEVLMRRYPIVRAVDAAVLKNSFKVMVLLRLNCLIPFGVLNYVFGISGVDWVDFMMATPIGILPWHALLIFLGASAETIYDEEAEKTLMGTILIAMGIAFGIIGLVITWRYAKIELQKEVDSAPPLTARDYRIPEGTHEAWRSPARTTESPQLNSIEDADLHVTDYVMIHLGMERQPLAAEFGTDHYQTKLGWNEIILDDFS